MLAQWVGTASPCPRYGASMAALPEVPDLQCSWQRLLQCTGPRAKHLLRTLPFAQSLAYAEAHDEGMWRAAEGIDAEPAADPAAAPDPAVPAPEPASNPVPSPAAEPAPDPASVLVPDNAAEFEATSPPFAVMCTEVLRDATPEGFRNILPEGFLDGLAAAAPDPRQPDETNAKSTAVVVSMKGCGSVVGRNKMLQ